MAACRGWRMPSKAHIIGQDEAVHAVAGAIKRARADLSGRHRPASFIFVGPTGVGKTELVKQLASQLFDTVDPLISIDMSEYMEKYAVSRLIGSPPGLCRLRRGRAADREGPPPSLQRRAVRRDRKSTS